MTRALKLATFALALLCVPVTAQLSIPEIPYDAVDPLKLPDDLYLGEAAGVATNSKGNIFVYTRTGQPVGHAGHAPHVLARCRAPVRVRSLGQVHSRDRAGPVRVPLRAHSEGRSRGQHLGRRRRIEHGDQVRSRRARADDDGPQAGGDSGAASTAPARACATCRRCRATGAAWYRRAGR